MNWKRTDESLAPEGVVVHSKIDDGKGCRSEQTLKRLGTLWYFADGSMYVYYTPTHWAVTEVGHANG